MDKVCVRCGYSKPTSEFHYRICKVCTRLATNKWNIDNKEKIKQNYRDNRERILLRAKKYQEDPDKKANSLALQSIWRARKKNKLPIWADTPEMFSQFKAIYRKAIDMTRATGIQYEVDHIIPLCHKDVTGLHIPGNLEIITAAENIIKLDTWDGTQDNISWKKDMTKLIECLQEKYSP